MYYPAKFTQEDGAYIVTFRDVPESITQGGNFEEAMFLAEDVLICGLEFYFENDKPIPLPSEPQADEIMVYLSDIVYVKALLHNARLETEMSKAEFCTQGIQHIGLCVHGNTDKLKTVGEAAYNIDGILSDGSARSEYDNFFHYSTLCKEVPPHRCLIFRDVKLLAGMSQKSLAFSPPPSSCSAGMIR